MMWSPARLLRWRTPDTLPWASVTPFAGLKLGAFPFVGEAEAPFVGMPVIGSMVGTPPGVFPGVFCPGVEFGVAGGTGSTWKAALIALAAPGTFTTMWSSPPLPAYLGIEGTTTGSAPA